MAYEETDVSVSRSQEQVRRLIYMHEGTGLMLLSNPPREGFEAMVGITGSPYRIRVMAVCRAVEPYDRQGRSRAVKIIAGMRGREERRVWRVLYHHLKAMFEATDSGVIDIRDVIMPYVVLRDGMTLADHIKPQMAKLMTVDPGLLLPGGVS
jgi:hypothetical protein